MIISDNRAEFTRKITARLGDAINHAHTPADPAISRNFRALR